LTQTVKKNTLRWLHSPSSSEAMEPRCKTIELPPRRHVGADDTMEPASDTLTRKFVQMFLSDAL